MRWQARTIMVDRPDLRLVDNVDDEQPCSVCGEPATTRSAVDGAPLCLSCFTDIHWHPSWNRNFQQP
jgi:hypothetical protein